MECKRCHNTNPALMGTDRGMWYCRKCIGFGRLNIGEDVQVPNLKKTVFTGQPSLEYDLTPAQKAASAKALEGLQSGKDVFVYAATGAGKTEMTFASICWYLSKGKKVCFAISRRQVVLEIAKRLASAFPTLEITPVTKGYTRILDGDIIVCTTHQLFRYPESFDLLILDELDAFPFVNNEVLESIAMQACRGQRLMLSATPDKKSMEEIARGETVLVELFARPHGHRLPEPKIFAQPLLLQILTTWIFCARMVKKNKRVLVFVPRKRDQKWLTALFSIRFAAGGIDSGSEDKDAIMDAFASRKIMVLFATTLLERGITVPSVQVVVMQADHIVFTSASLIQIFGRIGRTFQDPDGVGLCLCKKVSREIVICARQIHHMNVTAASA